MNPIMTDKRSKQRRVLYWAVDLDTNDVMSHPIIKEFLKSHPHLKPLQKIHSTLLFVGKGSSAPVTTPVDELAKKLAGVSISENPEDKYVKLDGKSCTLTVSGYGHSDKAIALNVTNITLCDGDRCPSNAVRQHVTVALAQGTKAMDSVKTLLGEGTVEKFEEPLILKGTIKGFYF